MEPNNERKTPAGEQNELFKKQVFSDETLHTADPDEEETGELPCSTNALPRAKQNAKPHSRRRQNRRFLVLPQSW